MIIDNVLIYNGEYIMHVLNNYISKISGVEYNLVNNRLFLKELIEVAINKCLVDDFGKQLIFDNTSIYSIVGLTPIDMYNRIVKSETIPIWLLSKGVADIITNIKSNYKVESSLSHVSIVIINSNIHINVSTEIEV